MLTGLSNASDKTNLFTSEKIRSENLVAKAVMVFVRTSPFQKQFGFYSNSRTVDFPIATNNSICLLYTSDAADE